MSRVTYAETVEEPDNLYALSACLMDADTGRVLFEKNGTEHRANASTTKILTLIVTLEQADLTDIVTVSEYAASQPDVQLNICAGEQYLLGDLCYSLMLESHNDAAVAIAEHVGKSVEGFAALMNQKAKEIGCSDSYFITPNGLDASDENGSHGTTAEDLARILSYCITDSAQRETFLEITRTPAYTFSNKVVAEDGSVSNGSRSYSCNNHNAFLQMYEGALTGKTGFTGDAGYCYAGAVRRGERTYVVALLGCGWPNNKSYKWSDTKKLMEYGVNNYEPFAWEDTEQTYNFPDTVTVIDAKTSSYNNICTIHIDIAADDEASFADTVLKRLDEKVTIKYRLEKKLTAPVRMGEEIGYIEYHLGDLLVGRKVFVCSKSIEANDFTWNLHRIFDKFSP